jgi:hypothetical protein
MNLGTFGRHVLLTGAGFSKPFGGRLAGEIWADILSRPEIQACPAAHAILLRIPFFEEALTEAAANPDPQVYIALEAAVLGAFEKMDFAIQNSTFGQGYGVNIYKFQEFLNLFWGPNTDTGYLFTLNQDLLLERKHYNFGNRGGPVRPGIATPPGQHSTNVTWFSSLHINFDSSQIADIAAPSAGAYAWPPPLKDRNNYIKLHGSMDWRAPSGRLMVMGSGKASQIAGTPILEWYLEVFKSVLAAGDRRLMVFGYGFGDEHINEAIADACQKSGLKIYIWNAMHAADAMARVTAAPHGSPIWNALMGYCQDSLETVFPGDQSISAQYNALKENFFNS